MPVSTAPAAAPSTPRAAPATVTAARETRGSDEAPSGIEAAGSDRIFTVIDTVEQLAAAAAELAAGHGPVAVDAERASGYRYGQEAYLVQIYRRDGGTHLIDTHALRDLQVIHDVIADEEWVFHAASQDLTCLREVNLDPARIFDTELGARLAGLPRVGLAAVADELLGIHLPKSHSAADWSTRPLPNSWLLYAAHDVELLVDIRDRMADLLESQGKLELAHAEFADVLTRDLVVVRAEPWRRLNGLQSVKTPTGRAVAKALWESRDELARELDSAPGRLVPDASLSAAAAALPATRAELAGLKSFHGRQSRTQLDRWWAAIEAGRAAEPPPARGTDSSDTLPPPRSWAQRNSAADARLKSARATLAELAESHSMPPENLLTPDTLRRVAWEPPEPVTADSVAAALSERGARPWQVEIVAAPVAAAFVDTGNEAATASEQPLEESS